MLLAYTQLHLWEHQLDGVPSELKCKTLRVLQVQVDNTVGVKLDAITMAPPGVGLSMGKDTLVIPLSLYRKNRLKLAIMLNDVVASKPSEAASGYVVLLQVFAYFRTQDSVNLLK